MRYVELLFLAAIVSVVAAYGQVSNLRINGVANSFAMTSGDIVQWEYSLPSGSTAHGEIWFDSNGDGVLEEESDLLYFSFDQTDGVNKGDGPGDQDGVVNGLVSFTQRWGLAPGSYFFRFSNNGSAATAFGTVYLLNTPAHTIAGRVFAPSGRNAGNLIVEASRSTQYDLNFWDAVTGPDGFYIIQMNGDTAGNPWTISILNNPFDPLIPQPQDTLLTILENYGSVNFSFVPPAAVVTGIVRDDIGVGVDNIVVRLSGVSPFPDIRTRTNSAGGFHISLTTEDLATGPWFLQTEIPGQYTTNLLDARHSLPQLRQGDSAYRALYLYFADSQISGHILMNGSPLGFPVTIIAMNPDTAEARAQSDPLTGAFHIPASSKIAEYMLVPLLSGALPVSAHAGDSNIVIDVLPTEVSDRGTGLQKNYQLGQNYPNPFNPATHISFAIPHQTLVDLRLYDLLGKEVKMLVHEVLAPGNYSIPVDASSLASGTYLYRLTAGTYVNAKRLVVIK